jgi:ribonuclease HI
MIKIYFDGSCRPNSGGIATYGFVIYRNKKQLAKGSGVIGTGKGMTSNVAEYGAIFRAIKKIKKMDWEDKLLIKGDSELVIKQLSGKCKITSDTSKKYVPKVLKALRDFKYKLKWIPKEKNTKADILSRQAYSKYSDVKRD